MAVIHNAARFLLMFRFFNKKARAMSAYRAFLSFGSLTCQSKSGDVVELVEYIAAKRVGGIAFKLAVVPYKRGNTVKGHPNRLFG